MLRLRVPCDEHCSDTSNVRSEFGLGIVQSQFASYNGRDMRWKSDPHDITDLSKEMADSPLGRIWQQVSGVDQGTIAHCLEEGLRDFAGMPLASVAQEAGMRVNAIAPRALAICERMADEGPRLAEGLFEASQRLSSLAAQNRDEARAEANRFMVDGLGITPEEAVDPVDLASLLSELGKWFGETAAFARQALDDYNSHQTGILAAYLRFPDFSQLKGCELMNRATISKKPIDPVDPEAYAACAFVTLALGRPDVVSEQLNLRCANNIVTGVITQRYIDVGGEQGLLEPIVKSGLDKGLDQMSEAPLKDAARVAGGLIRRAGTLAESQQSREIRILSKMAQLKRSPVSLDAVAQNEEGESVPIANVMESPSDLEEAIPQYYEAVSKLPKDMQPVFRRVWEKGESPREAATSLGYKWNTALERRLERWGEQIRCEMLG